MIYLHIGRHKTGTSALQKLLRKNRKTLVERGFNYLQPARGGSGNHDLANALNPAWMARADDAQQAIAARELEAAGRRLTHRGHKIVSSEAFQAVPPAAAAGFFPPGQTTVIVYVREQLDYLLSAYAQFVQAQQSVMPFVDYAARLRTRHDELLDGWTAAFGREFVKPRLYARGHLKDGDIRHDFLALVGIEPGWLEFKSGLVNPTIGPELIEAKGLINAFVSREVQDRADVFNLLAGLALQAPGRIGVSPAFAERLRARFAESNARLFQTYMAEFADGFPMKDFTPASPPINPVEALERTLGLIEATAPDSAALLRQHLPGLDQLKAARPLLPHDWAKATARLDQAQDA